VLFTFRVVSLTAAAMGLTFGLIAGIPVFTIVSLLVIALHWLTWTIGAEMTTSPFTPIIITMVVMVATVLFYTQALGRPL